MKNTSVSLLERLRTHADDLAWKELDDLYRPFILRCLLRDPTLRDEAADLAQEVLAVVVRELATFERERTGSFRAWLRLITLNRLKAFWRSRRRRPHLLENDAEGSVLAQLEDPHSALSRLWDQEHNEHVVRRLLDLIEQEFTPKTVQAFRRTVFDDADTAEVALELGMSAGAVLSAKSRVLQRLRQEGEGLLS